MFFKNIFCYQLHQPPVISAEEFARGLEPARAKPCGKTQPFALGWTSPQGRTGTHLVHVSGRTWLFCALREERLLPSSVIRDAVLEKSETLAAREQRKVSRQEKERLRDEVILELLPRAFTRQVLTYAYLDWQHKWLIVNTSSAKRADELVLLLRDSIPELCLRPLVTAISPADVMTRWGSGEPIDPDWIMQDRCEIRAVDDSRAIVRCDYVEVESEEIQMHLRSGKRISRLALAWQDKLEFQLREDCTLRRIVPLGVLQEERDQIETESAMESLDADLFLLGSCLGECLSALIAALGGYAETETLTQALPKAVQVAEDVVCA